jgi:hypothetical protein
MKGKTFTGEDLEKALLNDELPQPGLELVGMVKKSEHEEHISFTSSGCEQWVDVPISLIEQAENVGHSQCKDHSHPLFRITFKEQKSPEARLFSALLVQLMSGKQGARSSLGPMQSSPSAGLAPIQRRGPFGNYGGVLVPTTNIGYWPTPDGYQCAGFWDCINMINAESCREVKCWEGWVTGDPVCICYR